MGGIHAPVRAAALSAMLLAASAAPAPAQPPEDGPAAPAKVDPLRAHFEERARVRLVVVDTVVVDEQARTVPDLTVDDFVLTVDGAPRRVDTFDVTCPAGAAEDPRGLRSPSRRGPPPASPERPRRIVIALDYQHLSRPRRVQVIDHVREAVRHGTAEGDELMVVALVGGLRVEQPFIADRRAVIGALDRMEYDITLWQPEFAHLTEKGFLHGLHALFGMLETIEGPKALVLYSDARALAPDLEYAELAAASHAARCPIYPVSATGLEIPRPG